MFAKFLLTALVIVGAIVVLRKRRDSLPQSEFRPEPELTNTHTQMMKWLAYGLVASMLITGVVFYYLDWKDDHRLYQIRIVNPQTGQQEIYRAYKKDLKGRSFTTLSNQQVTVSELERLELQEELE